MSTTTKKYLGYDGLSTVANKIKDRLEKVTTMPASPSNGDAVLYVGTTTSSYTNGLVYIYDSSTSSWRAAGGGGGSSSASNVSYDNTISGLDATNVQDAIDEDIGNTEASFAIVQGILGEKADIVSNATSGNFASLDASGNLTDSGHKHSDYLTSHQDISGKMDTDGNNAASDVTFSGAFTVGSRASGSTVGTNSFTQGSLNKATGNYSHAEGYKTEATGSGAHAEGYITMGSGTGRILASGLGAHAEGLSNDSTNYTRATADGAHAEGCNTQATGNNSHAEGCLTIASNRQCHAEGDTTVASGDQAHSEGFETTASGDTSHAGGYRTTAAYNNQTTIGIYNDNKSTTLFEVGNGYHSGTESNPGTITRQNAFEVYSNGDINYTGTLKKNGTEILDSWFGTTATVSSGAFSFTVTDSTLAYEPWFNIDGNSINKNPTATISTITTSDGNTTINYTTDADDGTYVKLRIIR